MAERGSFHAADTGATGEASEAHSTTEQRALGVGGAAITSGNPVKEAMWRLPIHSNGDEVSWHRRKDRPRFFYSFFGVMDLWELIKQ